MTINMERFLEAPVFEDKVVPVIKGEYNAGKQAIAFGVPAEELEDKPTDVQVTIPEPVVIKP